MKPNKSIFFLLAALWIGKCCFSAVVADFESLDDGDGNDDKSTVFKRNSTADA